MSESGRGIARTAQERAQSSQQFLEVEGLHQVIVGAGIQPRDAIVNGIARGQHENRRAETGAAQFAADRVAALQRQHHVQDDNVVRIDRRLIQGAFSVGRNIHRVSLLPQALGQESGDADFVFHQQNTHALLF